MCQNTPKPCCPDASICPARERLAFALGILFLIVLLVAIFFPQSAAIQFLPFVAGLFALAIRSCYRTQKKH